MDISDYLTDDEIELFAKCLSESARDGHFDSVFSDKRLASQYLKKVSTTNMVPGYKNARGLLFTFRKGRSSVCFALICSSIFPQADSELLFFVVPKEYRNKGYGKMALNLLLDELKGKSLMARCMPKSTFIVTLLKGCGFVELDLGPSKNINLIYKNG